MPQTKAQQDMALAQRLVQEVKNIPDEKARKIYGGLCHNFPVLVRTCGLCQALAFSADKATEKEDQNGKKQKTPQNLAHQLLREHIAQLLETPDRDPLVLIREESAADYMLHTRRVLAAWIYFKRFAVSILKVSDAQEAEGDQANAK